MPPETRRYPAALQRFGQRLGVGHNLRGIFVELRAQRLSECHSLGGDNMHQRAALLAGKYRLVDRLRQFLRAR